MRCLTSRPSPNTIASGLLSKFRRIQEIVIRGAGDDLGARLPDEIDGREYRDAGCGRRDRPAIAASPAATSRSQISATIRGGPVDGPRAVDQPVDEVLQFGRVHEASICGAVCGNVKATETRRSSAPAATAASRPPARDAAGNDPPARRPSWLRRPALRGCRRRGRDGPWSGCRCRRPMRSTVRRGDRIDDVGFTAKRATTGWPVEMPPRMPPAWLDRNRAPSLPIRISSAFSSPVRPPRSKPAPISTPLTALMLISAAASSASSLA